MNVFVTLLGAAIVFAALRDVFQQLFRPGGSGSLSRALMRGVWNLFRRLAARNPTLLVLAGPSVLLTAIAVWVALVVIGWALIFWPHLPGGFRYATGLEPSGEGSFIDAVYLSLVTLTTLGYGDITPTSAILRFLAPLEALVGFGLLTAAISWVLSVYPVISRRRGLAREVALIREAESETGIAATRMDAQAVERTLETLTTRLISISGDLLQFPVTYYFYDGDEGSSLSAHMPSLLRLAEEGRSTSCPPAVRLRAAMLRGAIDDFSDTVASRFVRVPSTSTDKILEAYARDHLHLPSGKRQGKRARSDR